MDLDWCGGYIVEVVDYGNFLGVVVEFVGVEFFDWFGEVVGVIFEYLVVFVDEGVVCDVILV